MPSLTCFNRRFTFSWPMALIAFGFIALFLRLGFWQISRAAEKEGMLEVHARMATQPVLNWNPMMPAPKQYQNIEVRGQLLPQVFFLDNQHRKHVFGYDVLSPLELENHEVILVDRGWVRGDVSRQILPQIAYPSKQRDWVGRAYFPTPAAFSLGPMLEKRAKDIIVIEEIDAKKLSHVLQKKVYPFIIRLDKQQAHGFVREWAVVSMPPQRHLAYALQWFAMALVILIIFIALNLKKKI